MNAGEIDPVYAEYVAGRSELRAEFDELDERLYGFMDLLWEHVEPHPFLEDVVGMDGTIEYTIATSVNEVRKHWSLLLEAIDTLVDAVDMRHLPGCSWTEDVPRH